jgi:DNA-binding CsgD family transcriptional regulator
LLTLLAPHLRGAYRQACLAGILTPRQREVLRLVGIGLTNREVARRLRISPGTVRVHLEHSYERLGVGSRTGAIARTA